MGYNVLCEGSRAMPTVGTHIPEKDCKALRVLKLHVHVHSKTEML